MLSKDEYTKRVGENIRSVRNEKNMSMETLAFELGIEYRQLGRIERGEINTTIHMLYRIAVALKIEPKELL